MVAFLFNYQVKGDALPCDKFVEEFERIKLTPLFTDSKLNNGPTNTWFEDVIKDFNKVFDTKVDYKTVNWDFIYDFNDIDNYVGQIKAGFTIGDKTYDYKVKMDYDQRKTPEITIRQ